MPAALGEVNLSQLAETQGQLVHPHQMEEDAVDQGPPLPVVMTEEAVTSAARSGQPRTPFLGDRRQAAGGPDGTTPRETACVEPEESQSPQGLGTPRQTSRGRLGQAAEVVMAGLSSALTVIEEALANPSQTAVGKLEVGTATWRTLADAWAVEKAGGPGVSQEVLREAGLNRPPWAQG